MTSIYNRSTREMYPNIQDKGDRFDDVWYLRKNALQPKKMKKVHLEPVAESKTLRKCPKRLINPIEMSKYFIGNTSVHGVRYWLDEQLYKIERFIWVFAVLVAFYWAIKIVCLLYADFQANKSTIVIDDINSDIFTVPFPSVTICPSNRVDWKEATKLVRTLIPPDNEEATQVFKQLLRTMSNMRFSHLYELQFNVTNSTLQIFKDINVTEVLLKVMPKCEDFLVDCSWSYSDKNCCEIFEIQKTFYGFCYAFNSVITENRKLHTPISAHAYGFHSGLQVMLQLDKLHNPPDTSNKNTAIFMISHPQVNPAKGRAAALGQRYNVDIKFTSAYAAPEILALENEGNAPCKYKNGEYKFENCLTFCQRRYIQRICGCNPTFFFAFTYKIRECTIKDIQCIANASEQLIELHYLIMSDEPHAVQSVCNCPTECEYKSYDDFVIPVPFEPNYILLDVHFDGPTGVRYRREIVISDLHMLVQFGGIFGLFVGGSLLSLAEFLYCLVTSTFYYIYRRNY